MVTEEEAREVADGEEVQVEAADLGTTHLQVNLDSKLSSHGDIKDKGKIMDSTEGILRVTEDQVFEKAPSVAEIPPQHTPNGTASSLNGHMKEAKISNERPQENGQKDNEKVEASSDGINTDQSNKSNGEETVDSFDHIESTTEDTSLLKSENEEPKEHYQQDVEGAAVEDKMVHKDTLQADEPTVDAQQGQNLELAEVTEDTQHASTSCNPHDEVVADAPAGVQTSLEPNADDSAPLPDATDGNTETEPAKVDKESFPEDEDIAEHTHEIIKLEDQPSKQADDVDADLVQEEVPKSKKTDMPEDMTTTEQAHESTNGDQEVLNQESPEDTSDPVHEKTEETSHESNVSASEETTPEHDATAREPALDVQEVQNPGLAEEIADAKEVDTEKTVQESGVAFEEATSEDNIPTIEPSSDIQHPNNVESEEIKGLEEAKAEETSNQSNVTIAEDTKDKEATKAIQPVQGLEEEPKNSGTAEMDEASNEPPDVLNNLAEEDSVPACQPQVIELEEVKDAGVTETQEITQQSHVAASEELETEDNSREIESSNDDIQLILEQGSVEVKDTESSETQEICKERSISASEDHVEDDVTAEGPTSDAQKVKNVESAEEIKDNTADNIVEASNVTTVEEADQQNNVLTSEDVSEQKMRGLEPEEIQNTEPVETEEASDQRNPALFNNPAQEDIIPSDIPKTESTAEVTGIEATKTKALPQESNVSISDEPASEENATASEITCDAQEVNDLEQAEDVEGNKDTRTKETSDQSNESNASLEEIATEDSTTILTDISIQQLEEQEPVEFRGTETTEPQGISPSHIVSTSEDSASEDKVTAEPSPDTAENLESAPVTKETKDVKSTDAIAEEETPEDHVQELEAPIQTPPVEEPELEEIKNTDNQMDATVLENPTHEDDPTTSESLVIESAEGSSSGVTEGQEMPQIEVAQSEDHKPEENKTASEPEILEPEPADEMRDSEATEPQSISQQSIVSSSEESVPEEDVTAREAVSDIKEVQTEVPELIDEHNDVKAGEISNQSSGTIVGEAAQENLESAIVTEETRDVKSIDAIAEETPELEETKNTEPVELHDNVMTNDLPAEEVKDIQATEIAEIHNESSNLTEDVKSNVAFTDETAPDKHAKAIEATADIPQAQDPEPEETKNSEPVEVEDNMIASDLPEEEINDTEAMETKVTHDESTSAKITELTNDALAEEATPEEPVIETEATIVIPRAQEPELEDIKDTKTVEVEENISATDQAEEIEATDDIETEAINESIKANNSELTEDVTAKEPASDVKEVQSEEPELIDEPNDVKAGEISNQSRRTIVGEAAQENLQSTTGTEETREVKSTDVIAEEKTAEELVQEFEGPVDIPPVEEPELEETKNTEPVEVHDNVTTNELPAEEVNDTEATEIAEIQNECADLTEDVKSNVPLADQAAPDEHAKAIEATADIPQVQEPELEDIKNSEHVEVGDNIIASDLPKEEIKDIEAMETEMIPDETTGANISELTNAVKSNVALAEEAAPEDHGTETEATIDIPQAQEPELEEVKNTEPGEVEENISAIDQSAEEIKASEAMETEAVHESIDANNSKLAKDVERNSALEDDAAHEEHVIAAETTVQIPRAQEPELEEIKNSEPVEVKENMSASDLPAEEVNETEATKNKVINENTDANISEPTEDANRNVAVADEAAPEEHVIATEATVDIPRAQEPELEEIKNVEHVEVEENITATDLPAEEVEETEVISESTDANISEPTEDANRNVAVADEATPEELVIATEATADIPPAQEPELEEIENAEHVEVEENITASNLPAEEMKETQDAETEVISESTDGKINEPTDDVKKNGAVADEAAPEEHLIATEAMVDIPRAQEPGIEEIENAEHVEAEENISASDLPAEEVKETEVISESTDANITEPTEDAKINVALANEAAPEQHVIATEATVDIPRAQEPELEETENAEHLEVEENISANDLPAEEVKGIETMETGAISSSTDANITELTEDVALANEAVPDVHVDIPPAQEPALEEINNTEPVEAEDSITADDIPAEEINETKFMETEEISHESTDDSLTASAPLADIQQAPEQEAVKDKCTDTTQNQGEPQQSIVSTAAEPTRTEEKPTVTELASDVQQVLERDSTEETTGIEDVQTEDDQQQGVSNLQKPVSENDVSESEPNVADQEVQEDKTAEVEDTAADTAAMEAEEISTQDNIPTTENAAQESSEPGNDPDLLVQSEDIKEELLKAEETGQSNGATLEEETAEDNATNETGHLADTKQVHGLESVKEYSGVDATEGEEASHPTSQDAGLEELVSESNLATTEPTSDIQQVDDLDEAREMTATEAINDEEISYPKTEVATLEDPSPTDNGMSPKQNSVELDEETLGTEINNAEPIEQKDESSDVGEKTAFTTQKGESPTEEDDVQSSGDDTVGISNNIEQIKEHSKAVTEDDAIKRGEHTIDQDDKQLHSVELQTQVCERSVDVSAIEQPDDDVQKVNLGQQQKEDEVIKEQAEEIQRDEQKHDDSSTELTTETLLEHQSNEIGTTNWNEDTDMFEAEKTETVATEMFMNEQTPHIQQGSTPAIADAKVENSTEIKETPEQENAPNNTGTLYTDADAENHNEDEKENLETDAAVVKPSTDEQDGTTDETEVGNGLTSSAEKDLQKTSEPAPSNEQTLENIRTIKNPTVVPRNVEPKVHSEEKACINKANDGMQAIQASQEEILDEVENKQEMQNEDTCVNNDEIQTKPLNEDASELHSNDSTDIKMDDTISPYAEMTHGRIEAQPTEIEEVEENKGFRSISEYAVQCSNQNDVEHNLSIHPKAVDDNLATTEQNDAEVETNSNEEMATSYTAVTDAVDFDEAIDNKANGADGALSDENLETSEDNRRNLEASSAVTSLGESMNEGNEHHNLALPAHSAVDGNTAEQASGLEVTERGLLFPEKPLLAESEEYEESQTTKERDEEDLHEKETSDTEKEEKEAEQSDLPVSNFLMNLIMGKESPKPDSNLETEAEMKQEETTKDDSGLINSQQEESLVPIPTEYKVDNKLIFEQGKHNLEGSEETHDFKLESDEELSRNTHELEAPVSQNNVQDEISGELVPGGPGLMTEVESRNVKLGERATDSVCQEHMEVTTQIEEGGLKSNIDDSTKPKASQEGTLEGTTDLPHESLPEKKSSDAVARQTLLSTKPDTGDEEKLPNDTDDLQSPLSTKREESTESSIIEAESTIEAEPENEVEKEEEKHHTINTSVSTGREIENLHDDSQKGTEAISDEKTAEITELVIGTEINLVDEKEISAGPKCEDKKQSNYELPNSELDSSEKALDVQSDGSSLHIKQDKQDEFAGDQIVMDKNSLLDKPGESNLHEEQEAEFGQESPKESDGGGQNCLAIREPVIEEENVNRTVESHVQTVNTKSNEEQETFKPQVQERDFDVVSAKEALEAEENFVEMAKPELSTDEERSQKEDKLNMAGEKTYDEKTKDGEEAKSFTDEATTKIEEQGAVQKASHNQTRDLNVVLPTKTPGSEESFVDIKTPEFSTDEEQSPKKDEPKMAEEKSSDKRTDSEEEAKNFTDETPKKIEEREAGQKASPKKHNILSGVGSKVKHQLAKVKKAIIGKPGHTKSELAKS